MNYQLRDASKKKVVELYQAQLQESIDKLKSTDGRLSSEMKSYIKVLEDNLALSPIFLGYMQEISNKKIKT